MTMSNGVGKSTNKSLTAHLVQYESIEVGHVALVGHRALIIILKVLLQGDWVMGYLHHSAQVMREHLSDQIMQSGKPS
jgi:hypothetical protein